MTNKTVIALRRAYTSKENVKPKGLTTWLILIALIIGLASCNKEAEKPIQLRPPARSLSTVDITIKFFPTTHPLAPGNLYGLQIRSSHKMRVATQFWIEWKDGTTTWQLRPFILANESTMDWHTMIPIVKGASDLRLVKVEGDTTIIYRLKQIL